MASLEDVELWMDEELLFDVYVPSLKQWTVGEVKECNHQRREILVSYQCIDRADEWLNVDQCARSRFAELYTRSTNGGTHEANVVRNDSNINNHTSSSNVDGDEFAYVEPPEKQIESWCTVVIDSVREKYAPTDATTSLSSSSSSSSSAVRTGQMSMNGTGSILRCDEFVKHWLRSSSDSDDIHESVEKISLSDPLTRCRIRVPARGNNCTHANVFDARAHIEFNTGKSEWKCGWCKQPALPYDLEIDPFILAVLLNKCSTQQCHAIPDHRLVDLVERELSVGLSDESEDRYLIVNDDNTFHIEGEEPSGNVQSNGKNHSHGASHSASNATATNTKKRSANGVVASINIDGSDSDVSHPAAASKKHMKNSAKGPTTSSIRAAADSSPSAAPKDTPVIDLTSGEYDDASLDSFIARITVKEENLNTENSVAEKLLRAQEAAILAIRQQKQQQRLNSPNASHQHHQHQHLHSQPSLNGVPISSSSTANPSYPNYAPPPVLKQRSAAGVAALRQEAAALQVNINTATKAQLRKLKGVGAVTAQKIIEHREKILRQKQSINPGVTRAFDSPLDILSVDGIPYSLVDKIRWLITV